MTYHPGDLIVIPTQDYKILAIVLNKCDNDIGLPDHEKFSVLFYGTILDLYLAASRYEILK